MLPPTPPNPANLRPPRSSPHGSWQRMLRRGAAVATHLCLTHSVSAPLPGCVHGAPMELCRPAPDAAARVAAGGEEMW